jgi:hypothetical protein
LFAAYVVQSVSIPSAPCASTLQSHHYLVKQSFFEPSILSDRFSGGLVWFRAEGSVFSKQSVVAIICAIVQKVFDTWIPFQVHPVHCENPSDGPNDSGSSEGFHGFGTLWCPNNVVLFVIHSQGL